MKLLGMSSESISDKVLCEYKEKGANIYAESLNVTPYCGDEADVVVKLANPEKYENLDYEEAVDSPLNAYFLGPDSGGGGMLRDPAAAVVLCDEHAEEVLDRLHKWKSVNEVDPEDIRIPSFPASVVDWSDELPDDG
ncbi:hypothetical protein [Halobellus ordinarius]|uniref:hypothetical protein n=1 Tax=Halobellus ordinarius TaxID=3075120 RepID=UPI002880422D|nr:hypothetical protein [Halobellus sp. ZY16]